MNAKCNLILSALLMLIAMGANAQCKKSVAIFGDSYSTFENYLSCRKKPMSLMWSRHGGTCC